MKLWEFFFSNFLNGELLVLDSVVTVGCVLKISVVDKNDDDVIEDGSFWVVVCVDSVDVIEGDFWAVDVSSGVSFVVIEGELWVDTIDDNLSVVSVEYEESIFVVEGNFWVDVVDDKSDVVVVGDVIDVIDCVVVKGELTVAGKDSVVVEPCLVDSAFSDKVVNWPSVVPEVQLPLVHRQLPLMSL